MKNISKFTVALVIGSLFAGWVIATMLKPSNVGAAAVEPSAPSSGRYQLNIQQSIYVFDTVEGRLYQFSNGANGAPQWKNLGSPTDAK